MREGIGVPSESAGLSKGLRTDLHLNRTDYSRNELCKCSDLGRSPFFLKLSRQGKRLCEPNLSLLRYRSTVLLGGLVELVTQIIGDPSLQPPGISGDRALGLPPPARGSFAR